MPAWISLPVTVAFSVLVTGWLARGTTAPLRELTAATRAMATGDYSRSLAAAIGDAKGQQADMLKDLKAQCGKRAAPAPKG